MFLFHAKERSTQCAMLIGERKIISIIKNIRSLSETKDERRALKGLKNMWFNKNTITLNLAGDFYRGRCSQKKCCIYPATLLPYPDALGLRPVALRPTFSSGLPFTSSKFYEKNTRQLHRSRILFFRAAKQHYIESRSDYKLVCKNCTKIANFLKCLVY